MAVPNNTLHPKTFGRNLEEHYGYGDPTAPIESAQSQFSANASNELEEQLQILYSNRRIDEGYSSIKELDSSPIENVNWEKSLINSPIPNNNDLTSILGPFYHDGKVSKDSQVRNTFDKNIFDETYPGSNSDQQKIEEIDKEKIVSVLKAKMVDFIHETVKNSNTEYENDGSLLKFILDYSRKLVLHCK